MIKGKYEEIEFQSFEIIEVSRKLKTTRIAIICNKWKVEQKYKTSQESLIARAYSVAKRIVLAFGIFITV